MYKLLTIFLLFLTVSMSYAQDSTKTPEETVSIFYELIKHQDDESLTQAYAMFNPNYCILDERTFKHIAMSYDKNMVVEIVDATIKKNYAIVRIKCIVPSSFGGGMEVLSEVHMIRDKETGKWEINQTTNHEEL